MKVATGENVINVGRTEGVIVIGLLQESVIVGNGQVTELPTLTVYVTGAAFDKVGGAVGPTTWTLNEYCTGVLAPSSNDIVKGMFVPMSAINKGPAWKLVG